MKKAAVILALLFIATSALKAQSAFEDSKKTDYTITESTSLGGAIKVANDVVVTYSTGNVSGIITINSKAKTIKFSDRRIDYGQSKLKVEQFENSCLTSFSAKLADNSGQVMVQMIENYQKETINLLIQWPDYSAVKVMAKLKASKILK